MKITKKLISLSSFLLFMGFCIPIYSFDNKNIKSESNPIISNQNISKEKRIKTVISKGIGSSLEDARQNAVRNALTRVAGDLIDANTYIKKRKIYDDGISRTSKIIKTDVSNYSDGIIESFKVLDIKKNGFLWECTAEVKIRRKEFQSFVKNIASTSLDIPKVIRNTIGDNQFEKEKRLEIKINKEKQKQKDLQTLALLENKLRKNRVFKLEKLVGAIIENSIVDFQLNNPTLKENFSKKCENKTPKYLEIQNTCKKLQTFSENAIFIELEISLKEEYQNKLINDFDILSNSKFNIYNNNYINNQFIKSFDDFLINNEVVNCYSKKNQPFWEESCYSNTNDLGIAFFSPDLNKDQIFIFKEIYTSIRKDGSLQSAAGRGLLEYENNLYPSILIEIYDSEGVVLYGEEIPPLDKQSIMRLDNIKFIEEIIKPQREINNQITTYPALSLFTQSMNVYTNNWNNNFIHKKRKYIMVIDLPANISKNISNIKFNTLPVKDFWQKKFGHS